MKEFTQEEIERLVPEAKYHAPEKYLRSKPYWSIGIHTSGKASEWWPLLVQTRLDLETANTHIGELAIMLRDGKTDDESYSEFMGRRDELLNKVGYYK